MLAFNLPAALCIHDEDVASTPSDEGGDEVIISVRNGTAQARTAQCTPTSARIGPGYPHLAWWRPMQCQRVRHTERSKSTTFLELQVGGQRIAT